MSGLVRPWYNEQERIHEWAEITFGSPTHLAPLHKRVLSEVDELNQEVGMLGEGLLLKQLRSMLVTRRRIGQECADIVITLFRLCGAIGVDLMDEVDKKQTVNEGRKWRSFGDGTGQHIKND